MLFFRNNTNVPLFLSRVRTAQPYSVIYKCSCFRKHGSRLAAEMCKIGLFCYKV